MIDMWIVVCHWVFLEDSLVTFKDCIICTAYTDVSFGELQLIRSLYGYLWTSDLLQYDVYYIVKEKRNKEYQTP